MERKIVKELDKWRHSESRKPLIVYGARQVGKTHLALTFGKRKYKNTAYFNMEDSRELVAIFDRDLNPERIVAELAVKSGQTIFQEDTLIIFDEIQACERALTSLKYFCEQAPGYHIIATGSLLGIAVNREKFSFPVGKVDMRRLYPLDFEEFLWATGNTDLGGLIRISAEENRPLSLHESAMDLYRRYLVIGGMPEAVLQYVKTSDYNFVLATQKSLNDAYIADMAKYATPRETAGIMAAWASVPGQLAKENRKFQYARIKSGARAYEYEMPIAWLKAAGVINQCVKVTAGHTPLSAYADSSFFKLYMMDTGLLCSKFNLPAAAVITSPPSYISFKGALAENYVMQALVAANYTPYYWESTGKAEVDFVVQNREGRVIPIEAKAADNVRSKSLNLFMEKYEPPYALRISGKNFGFENKIRSIPLYGIYCLE